MRNSDINWSSGQDEVETEPKVSRFEALFSTYLQRGVRIGCSNNWSGFELDFFARTAVGLLFSEIFLLSTNKLLDLI